MPNEWIIPEPVDNNGVVNNAATLTYTNAMNELRVQHQEMQRQRNRMYVRPRGFGTRNENRIHIDPWDIDDADDYREAQIERARDMYHQGDVEAAMTLLHIELSYDEDEVEREIANFAKEQPTMEHKIQRFLRGEAVDGINQQVVDDYYLEAKKKRFLKRNERERLHKPCSDGDKPTSSVRLDDLVPSQ